VSSRAHVTPRAVILDIDGTMYVQAPVRAAMMVRLARASLRSPRSARTWLRVLPAYRAAQEALRDGHHGELVGSAGDLQHRLAAERSGVAEQTVRECVDRWMFREPCAVLAAHRRPGLLEFLRAARSAGVRVGVLSDYPIGGKLEALGVHEFVDVSLSAYDPEVGQFKPSPVGLLATARRLSLPVSECLYVGDRPSVDGVAASAAGMRAVIVGQRRAPVDATWAPAVDFHAVARLIALA
jgi:beta-phosphoglucomutase-like phosphatase (HAD superfamily)